MANRWGSNGNRDRLKFWGSKITADGDCSHEIKRRLLLARKAMTNLDILLRSRDITLLTKVRLVKALVFLVVMYGCESWIIKKAEHWRIDASELWCWKRLFESRLDCKEIQPVHPKGNQSWIFIGRTDAEAETTMLWPPEVKNLLIGKDSCWEGLKVGGEGDDWAWDGWMASLTLWKRVWVSSGSWWWTGKPGVLQTIGSQKVKHNWVTELKQETFLQNLKHLLPKLVFDRVPGAPRLLWYLCCLTP